MYSKQSSVNAKSVYATPLTYGYKNIIIPIINPTPATIIPQLFIDLPQSKNVPIRFKQNVLIPDSSSVPASYAKPLMSETIVECSASNNSYNTPYNIRRNLKL